MNMDDLGSRRNKIAQVLCNIILNTIATKTYCDCVEGAIILGLNAAMKEADDKLKTTDGTTI